MIQWRKRYVHLRNWQLMIINVWLPEKLYLANNMKTNILYRAYGKHNFLQIPQLKNFPESLKKEIFITAHVLPFKTSNYVTDYLIDWSQVPDDPLFLLNFPQKEMLTKEHFEQAEKIAGNYYGKEETVHVLQQIYHDLNPHPAGQQHNVPVMDGKRLDGIQHKYRETVLFFPRQGQTCHAYCTFCFRWPQFSGFSRLKFRSHEAEVLTEYVRRNRYITDVLFTGGDPMVMSTDVLRSYVEPLLEANLPNLQTIRIGTKALAYWPFRFTHDTDSDELIRLFERIVRHGLNLAIMAHFSHPAELKTPFVAEAIRRIRSTGAQIRTQSPVLRHINDDPQVWAEMWRLQVNHNCIPYYMFIARDTGAQHYFSLPLVRAWEIFRKAYQQVSGVCRTVRGPSMSCTPGKVQILGVTELPEKTGSRKVIVMRMLQGRNPDWVARPFFAEYNAEAIWIDQLKPAFGETKFFFEEELEKMFDIELEAGETDDFE